MVTKSYFNALIYQKKNKQKKQFKSAIVATSELC